MATGSGTNVSPSAHAEGEKPSQWISTSKAEKIENPQGEPFEGENGKVEIDLVGIKPDDIIDLSTDKARKRYQFVSLGDEPGKPQQAARDVVRTQEVLIRGKIPFNLITRIDKNSTNSKRKS